VASVFERGGRWYLRFKNAAGVWCQQVSTARTKTEARRLAEDLERKAERQRLGLEQLPGDSTLTVYELCSWWLENRCPLASLSRERSRLEHNVKGSELGALRLTAVRPAHIETHLQAMKAVGSSPPR
jgi:integrase